MFSQLSWPCLFNAFRNKKVDLLFCNNACEPPVPFMYNCHVYQIIHSQKMLIEITNYHQIQPAIS